MAKLSSYWKFIFFDEKYTYCEVVLLSFKVEKFRTGFMSYKFNLFDHKILFNLYALSSKMLLFI